MTPLLYLCGFQLYFCWCEEDNLEKVTKPRYGYGFPWPLSRLLPWKRKMEVKERMTSIGWGGKTVDEVSHPLLEINFFSWKPKLIFKSYLKVYRNQYNFRLPVEIELVTGEFKRVLGSQLPLIESQNLPSPQQDFLPDPKCTAQNQYNCREEQK